jgi:hypothetical protein
MAFLGASLALREFFCLNHEDAIIQLARATQIRINHRRGMAILLALDASS